MATNVYQRPPQRPAYNTALQGALAGVQAPATQLDQTGFANLQQQTQAEGRRITPEEWYGVGGGLGEYHKLYGLDDPGFRHLQAQTEASQSKISPEQYFQLGGDLNQYHKLYNTSPISAQAGGPISLDTANQATVNNQYDLQQQLQAPLQQTLGQTYAATGTPLAAPQLPEYQASNAYLPQIQDFNARRQQAQDTTYNAFKQQLDTQYGQAEQGLRQRLANEGIPQGSEKYQALFQQLNDQKARDYQTALAQAQESGRQEFSTNFNAALQGFGAQHSAGLADYNARLQGIQQGFGNDLVTRGVPLSELQGLTGIQSTLSGLQVNQNQVSQAEQQLQLNRDQLNEAIRSGDLNRAQELLLQQNEFDQQLKLAKMGGGGGGGGGGGRGGGGGQSSSLDNFYYNLFSNIASQPRPAQTNPYGQFLAGLGGTILGAGTSALFK